MIPLPMWGYAYRPQWVLLETWAFSNPHWSEFGPWGGMQVV